MLQQRTWRPLLDGADGRAALGVVRDIVAALPAPTDATAYCAHELALLHAYAAEALGDETGWERAAQFLARATERLASETLPASLLGGVAGIAWVVAHLGESAAGDDGEHDAVESALGDLVGRSPWLVDVDLFKGVAGLALYGLARGRRAGARAIGEGVVARLEETAERDDAGCRWLTPRRLLHVGYHAQSPDGHYDLGMAHGVAGVIAVLARLVAAGVAQERARALLEGAATWLGAQARHAGVSTFPSFVVPRRPPSPPARAAWCYGDPGVALALQSAANVLGSAEWHRQARDVARKAAARDPGGAGVVDAALCHGAAGLGHAFNRLQQATGDELVRDAARAWFRRCMAMRERASGIAGFRSLSPGARGDGEWCDDASLVSGAAGIALALLAAATDVEPGWDELLVMRVVDGV